MSGFMKRRFSRDLVLEKYVTVKVDNVHRKMAQHVDNFEAFADELRGLIGGVDVEAFQSKTIEDIYKLILKRDEKLQTLMFCAYVKASRMESQAADLFVEIIHSNKTALEVISEYLLTDSWPRSFAGMNMLTHVSRTDKIFTNAIMAPLNNIDRKNILPSYKISSPITSLFLILKDFAFETRDAQQFRK